MMVIEPSGLDSRYSRSLKNATPTENPESRAAMTRSDPDASR
jgi:hypothetical protein